MPFVPHTSDDERVMLASIGVGSIESLFDEIPSSLRSGELNETPSGISEMKLMRLMSERARQDEVRLSFLGAGAYEHHIPAAVWDLVSRGEFMTAYTPYQAEASQGTLQLIYEFQTMITRLMQMDVANASVYDGASAMAEAILMAVRANKKVKSRKVLVAGDINPAYVDACRAIVGSQRIELEILPYDSSTGLVITDCDLVDATAIVISYPNFFGGLPDIDTLTDSAHEAGALVIGVVNPTAVALLKPPGAWGESGADIAVAEGQPLGIPLSSGGPYLGIMCCSKPIVRQMPGRIIGRTTDLDGRTGFALTLQAREQHIRRGKATSNICTNQGLLVTAATIYLSLMGNDGLRSVAIQSHQGLQRLLAGVADLKGVSRVFEGPVFHEAAIRLPRAACDVLTAMEADGVLGGYDLGLIDERMADCILVNVTETKTEADIDDYVSSLGTALGQR
ncbi:MAG: aminomethyl-transferring glycine dehydrogenase subunit GcvPA [Gammaproteobacteria bacterium]|jgi:glycine dehydrogenase subunit 1|nr:aminomethyl-transferring glycine dehydrogenase subunit GcvPA [Gammaproteobacteria bacterium]MBT4494062.1 aminomethyl-transferring glycine dehydrogenase subunit GcvPA [Gammaproteobacteria bacterium]MBT7371659.1 aminomethyl-transferring glycine dehydrogenase subunit GcvPA [Gammaproteobacteria bacterium]